MRVLHIASGDLWAGAEVQVYLLATELSKLPNIEIQVALLNNGELSRRLLGAGIPVHIVDETTLSAMAIANSLRLIMRLFRPQIVHTHRTKENLLALLANVLTERAPLFRTVHGGNEHTASWYRQPAKWLLQTADDFSGRHCSRRVIAVSNPLGDFLRTAHGYRNVVVVPNGVDIDSISAIQVPAPFRPNGDRARHVGFAGRLEAVKRADIFLGMAATLIRRHSSPLIYFHVFGDGSQRSALESQSKQLGLAGRVTFHGHTTQVASWLGSLDVLVLCSDHEGLPMILLEAISAGTPVVAHATGGITEVLEGDIGGILVNQHDAEHYASAVECILDEESPPRDLATAHKRLGATYSAQRNAALIAAEYWKCMQK